MYMMDSVISLYFLHI